ncbi:MAG: vWA domain-containing protein [Anaerolineae bacterium]
MNASHPHRRRLLRDQQGQSLVLVALLLVVLLGFTALAVDVGLLMVGKARLQVALDAAVLAAVQELPDTGEADAVFYEYVGANFPVSALFPAPKATPHYSTTGEAASLNTVTATGTVHAPLHFARVLGLDSADIGAGAAAANVDPDLVLVIDRSGSMCEDCPDDDPYPCPGKTLQGGAVCPVVDHDGQPIAWQPMTDVKNAATGFVGALGDDTMMAVVSYNQSTSPPSPTLSIIGSQYAGIDAITPGGYTNIEAALDAARTVLVSSPRPNPKVIVLITDGRPNYCHGDYVGYCTDADECAEDAARRARDSGIIIVTIGFGDQAAGDVMAEIAAIGRGTYYPAPNAAELEQAFAEIADTRWAQLVPVD